MAKCDLNSVLRIAESEIGYLEKKSNCQLDSKTANAGSSNYTKYNRDYVAWVSDGAINMQWCASFVSWCFTKAYGLDAAKRLLCGGLHCYTPTGANRFKNKGQYIKRGQGRPKAGDVVYFYSSSKGRIGHVGIVEKVSTSKVYTIEGNTSGASALVTNGGGVKRKAYSLTSTYIDGYGRPDYAAVESGADAVDITEPGDRLLTPGCVGEDVRQVQQNLVKLGYDVGRSGYDGEYGPDTEAAVKAYQEAHGLDPDGEYGPLTHASMTDELAKLTGSDAPQPPEGNLTVAQGSWNLRTGPGTEYAIAGVAHGGDRLTGAGTDGWTPVLCSGEVRWISNKGLEEEKEDVG